MAEITVDRYRELLGNSAKGLSDQELAIELEQMREFVRVFLDVSRARRVAAAAARRSEASS